MKKLCLFISVFTFLFASYLIYAQQYEDVVYLKNGTIIHGTIIEQVPNESLKIKTKDGNVFVYKMDEISKTTKEQIVGVEATETTSNKSLGKLWFGFLGGPNFSNVSISSPPQSKPGPEELTLFTAGVFVERDWHKNLSTHIGVMFDRRGADKVDVLGQYYPSTFYTSWLDFDILIKGKLGLEGFNPFGLFGTVIGIQLSANGEYQGKTIDFSDHIGSMNLGLYFGAGSDINISKKSAIVFEFRYDLGLQNLNKDVGQSMVTTHGFKLLAGMKFSF